MGYWRVGQRITAARINRTMPLSVQKQSTTSRTSTISQTADPELVLPLLSLTVYKVIATMMIRSAADAAGDLQCSWDWTGTMTVTETVLGPHSSITTGTQSDLESFMASPDSVSATAAISLGATLAGVTAQVSAYVVCAVAGNLSLRWAQLNSNVNATSLLAGSSLEAFPVIFN